MRYTAATHSGNAQWQRTVATHSGNLEATVWREVAAPLDDSQRVTVVHERRTTVAQDGGPNTDLDAPDHQVARLQRGVDRLMDGYADEVISVDAFKPSVPVLKQRLEHLRAERDAVPTVEAASRRLHLVIGCLKASQSGSMPGATSSCVGSGPISGRRAE